MKKKILFLLLYFLFVNICTFIMCSPAYATFAPGSYNMVRDDENYFDYFDLTFTIDAQGQVSVSGNMGQHTNQNQVTANFTWTTFNTFDNNYDYIPILTKHNYTVYYFYYKVPKGSTYYAFNAQSFPSNEYNASFYCDQAYEIYLNNNTSPSASYSAGHVDTMTDYTSYALCNNYTDSTLTTIVWPDTPINPEATFENYEDSNYGSSLVTGEFTYFYFKVPKYNGETWPSWLYFHDTTNIDPPSYDYVNNSTSVYIDLNDYTFNKEGNNYIWRYLSDNDYNYYAIPSSFPFTGYLNEHTYELYLLWSEGNGTDIGQKSFTWTTDFTSAGIAKQQEILNDKTLTQQDKLFEYLTKGDVTNEIINLPSLAVSDPTYGFFSYLVYSITDAFYSTTNDETIIFTAYDTQYTIKSSDFNFLNSTGLSPIKNMLSIFWVFSIGFYILSDIRKEITRLKEFGWHALFADDISIDILG